MSSIQLRLIQGAKNVLSAMYLIRKSKLYLFYTEGKKSKMLIELGSMKMDHVIPSNSYLLPVLKNNRWKFVTAKIKISGKKLRFQKIHKIDNTNFDRPFTKYMLAKSPRKQKTCIVDYKTYKFVARPVLIKPAKLRDEDNEPDFQYFIIAQNKSPEKIPLLRSSVKALPAIPMQFFPTVVAPKAIIAPAPPSLIDPAPPSLIAPAPPSLIAPAPPSLIDPAPPSLILPENNILQTAASPKLTHEKYFDNFAHGVVCVSCGNIRNTRMVVACENGAGKTYYHVTSCADCFYETKKCILCNKISPRILEISIQ